MPIVRATSSVVMLVTRQSPIVYHMRMFFTGSPSSGSLMHVRGGRDRIVRLHAHAEEREVELVDLGIGIAPCAAPISRCHALQRSNSSDQSPPGTASTPRVMFGSYAMNVLPMIPPSEPPT